MSPVVLANGAVSTDLVPGGRNFQWGEFEGADRATPDELARLQLVVATILQPVRDAFGAPVVISRGGWLYSRFGMRRDREHANGSAVDFNVQGVAPFDVWRWIGSHLAGPPPRWGECIEERDHVHVTLYGFGGYGEFLREPVEGSYVAYNPRDVGDPGHTASFAGEGDTPAELDALTFIIPRFPGAGWILGLGIAIAFVYELANPTRRSRHA